MLTFAELGINNVKEKINDSYSEHDAEVWDKWAPLGEGRHRINGAWLAELVELDAVVEERKQENCTNSYKKIVNQGLIDYFFRIKF